MPTEKKPLTWTVEFSVIPLWVQDGFDLTESVAKDMIAKALPYGYSDEMGARILKSPPPALLSAIRKGG